MSACLSMYIPLYMSVYLFDTVSMHIHRFSLLFLCRYDRMWVNKFQRKFGKLSFPANFS